MREGDRPLLAPWLETFAQVFERFVTVERFEPAARAGADPGICYRMRMPPVFERHELIGNAGLFAGRARLCDYVRGLGFDWAEDGLILTVPTPSTAEALFQRAGDVGFHLHPFIDDEVPTNVGLWLWHYTEGKLPLHGCSARRYRDLLDVPADTLPQDVEEARRARPRTVRWQISTLAHDLSVHALNYHLIPGPCVRELGERVRAAATDGGLSWANRAVDVPVSLSYFFDNDLNRYCQSIWGLISSPEEFGDLFRRPDLHSQLLGALALRLREAAAFEGRPAPADTDALSPFEFRFPHLGSAQTGHGSSNTSSSRNRS